MAYQPNIPLSTDALAQSQLDIQGNFQALNPIFNGINNFILLPVQGSAPTTSATQMALFTRTSAVTAQPEMVIERQSSGATIEFTTLQTISSPPNTSGWTRLPSALIMKWGLQQGTGVNPTVINLNSTGPVLSSAFMAQVTPFQNGFIFRVDGLTGTTLTVAQSGGSFTEKFYWLVFGVE